MKVTVEIRRPGWMTAATARKVVPLVLLLVIVLLASPVLASHTFTDVPDSNAHHDDVAAISAAGISRGCNPPTNDEYCPADPVRRDQMGSFLRRGLGRVAETDIYSPTTVFPPADTEIGSVTLTPGTSHAGGTQFIYAQFSGTISLQNATGCAPCVVGIYLTHGTSRLHGQDILITLPGTTSGQPFPIAAGGVIAVNGTSPVTISLRGRISFGGGPSTTYAVNGNLTAATFPFGSTGSSIP